MHGSPSPRCVDDNDDEIEPLDLDNLPVFDDEPSVRSAPPPLGDRDAARAGLVVAAPAELDASWQPVNLDVVLSGELSTVTPTYLRRDDGKALFYERRVNGLHGDSGIGKSIVCAIAAAQEMTAGRDVVWVDFEDPDATVIVERLRMLGVDDRTISRRLRYYAPQTPFDELAVEAIEREALRCDAPLLPIDSIGEAFGLEGIDENKDTDVGAWLRRVARRLADTGAAVVPVDHATKAGDNPLHPSGSKRKRAAVTGASYLVEATTPLARGRGGRLRLVCAKDRHGNYRRGELVAVVELITYPDGGTTVHVRAPGATDTRAQTPEGKLRVIARAAARAAKDHDGPLSQRQLLARMSVKASNELKRAAIEEAVADTALREEVGPRGSRMYVYVHDFTDPEDAS